MQNSPLYVAKGQLKISTEDLKPGTIMKIEGDIFDGYHTFDELYEHRIQLFLALCAQIARQPYEAGGRYQIWRAKKHYDGHEYDGWFVMGIGTKPGEQITYHLPDARWEEADFGLTLEHAPEWDGHTPADVVERLKHL